MPRCFLHIGTHKTGTCALQRLFTLDDPAISGRIVYPRGGRVLNGQHNVAWELNGDPRFDPAKGTGAALIEEIARGDGRPAVVSSEDFEYLHARPEALAAFAEALRRAGIETRVIVYLRDRVSYMESLYAELTRHGPVASFRTFVETILRDGTFVFRDRWIYTLEYAGLIAPFVDAFGTGAAIVRPYPPGRRDASLATDFFEAIGLPFADAAEIPTLARENERADMAETVFRLRAYLRATRGAEMPDVAFDEPNAPFAPIDGGDIDRIAARFAEDDRALEARYGVRPNAPAMRPNAPTAQARTLDEMARVWELA
jgi:hypothetical protein